MPKLSLYKPERSLNFRFIDRAIRQQFTIGGTDLYIHKYLGTENNATGTNYTIPKYDSLDPNNIQDLLFLENRDRVYAPDVYRIRGAYNVQNIDFDLSQFGLFLNNDTIFINVHYTDMIDIIGRKLMVGDVIELPHLTDYHPLNETVPIGLRRYYQITDASWSSEGYSATWYQHLWRIKCEPLINSQEFNQILKQPVNKDNYMGPWSATVTYPAGYTVTWAGKTYISLVDVPEGIDPGNEGSEVYWKLDQGSQITDIISQYNKNIEINEAAIAEAARLVPSAGFDRSQLYLVPTEDSGAPGPPLNVIIKRDGGPDKSTGTIEFVNNPSFLNSSAAIRISAANLQSLWDMSVDSDASIDHFVSMTLQAIEQAPENSNGRSGSAERELVLSARALSTITGPYGTADNTYSRADQHLSFTVRLIGAHRRGDTVLNIINIVDNVLYPKLLLKGLNIPNDPFLKGTRITSVESASQIIISNPLLYDMESQTEILVSSDFDGVITDTNIMDYRADADPRFQFIRRSSPRSFGYIGGYLSGTSEAPNGVATASGTVFPANPVIGDYFLRLDYLPQKLFRWDGVRWVEISKNVRTATGMGIDDKSQLSGFMNATGTIEGPGGEQISIRQGLSTVLQNRNKQ